MLPVEHNDPVNAKILAVSEDKIEGFVREPFEEIANRSGVAVEDVMARIASMLRAGTIRRVRQTLLATNLAEGALVAWKVPEDKMDVPARSVLGSRGAPLDRYSHRRIGLQTLDDSKGSSGILSANALRIAGERS
jgi:DNA-binding Lrp family transcriptional regulator